VKTEESAVCVTLIVNEVLFSTLTWFNALIAMFNGAGYDDNMCKHTEFVSSGKTSCVCHFVHAILLFKIRKKMQRARFELK